MIRPMPEQDNENEAAKTKLEKLAERVRLGWAKLHPVTKAQLTVVEQRLREQWEQQALIRKGQKQKGKATQQPSAQKQKRRMRRSH